MFAHATNTSPVHAVDHLVQFADRIGSALVGAWEARRVYSQFSRLSDSQLAARGLTREDVSRMTLQALTNATGR
jgi:hypothetical protein